MEDPGTGVGKGQGSWLFRVRVRVRVRVTGSWLCYSGKQAAEIRGAIVYCCFCINHIKGQFNCA